MSQVGSGVKFVPELDSMSINFRFSSLRVGDLLMLPVMKIYAICAMLFLVVADSPAQHGLQAIRDEMDASNKQLDKQINWNLLRQYCPMDSTRTMHVPIVDLMWPQTKEDFIDGRFEEWLYPRHHPKRFLHRKTIRTETIIFNGKDDVVGRMSSGLTVAGCLLNPILLNEEKEICRVYHDSVPSDIFHIGWHPVSGYIYKVSKRWYIITLDGGLVRNEPLPVLLKEQWEILTKYGRFAKGPWDEW